MDRRYVVIKVWDAFRPWQVVDTITGKPAARCQSEKRARAVRDELNRDGYVEVDGADYPEVFGDA